MINANPQSEKKVQAGQSRLAGRLAGQGTSGTARPPSKKTDDRPYLDPSSRPSLNAGVAERVFLDARRRSPDGQVHDPLHKEKVIRWRPGQSRLGVWDMGHKPGHEYSTMHKKYCAGELTPEQFRAWYNDPKQYRPELVGTNRGHSLEKPSRDGQSKQRKR